MRARIWRWVTGRRWTGITYATLSPVSLVALLAIIAITAWSFTHGDNLLFGVMSGIWILAAVVIIGLDGIVTSAEGMRRRRRYKAGRNPHSKLGYERRAWRTPSGGRLEPYGTGYKLITATGDVVGKSTIGPGFVVIAFGDSPYFRSTDFEWPTPTDGLFRTMDALESYQAGRIIEFRFRRSRWMLMYGAGVERPYWVSDPAPCEWPSPSWSTSWFEMKWGWTVTDPEK